MSVITFGLAVCLLSSMAPPGVSSLHILISPLNLASHTLVFGRVAEELISRGHQVTFITASTMPIRSNLKKLNMDILTYKMDTIPFFQSEHHSQLIMNSALTEDKYALYDIFGQEAENELKECHHLNEDADMYAELKKRKFDIALVDLLPCMMVMPYRLNIPFVTSGVMCPSMFFRQPDLPSFVPRTFHDVGYTDNMSFQERLANTFNFVMELVFVAYQSSENFVEMYATHRPVITMGDLMRKVEFCFCTKLPILDYPQPTMPTMAFVELMARPPLPIKDKDLLDFIQSAKHGIIVVSFGTLVNLMPMETADRFVAAFKLLKQHVVWRFPGDPPANVPANVKLMKWLPQNELLGHPNTKLLIMHAGFSSLVEAVYNGIPMVVMPFFADQKYVAKVITHKQYGVQASIARFTPQSLADDINTVLNDPTYKTNMTKAANIVRHQLNPAGDVIEFWMKHIVEFGSGHLRSHAVDMPLYSYFMFDIAALVIGVFIILLCLAWCSCIILRGLICGKSGTKSKKD